MIFSAAVRILFRQFFIWVVLFFFLIASSRGAANEGNPVAEKFYSSERKFLSNHHQSALLFLSKKDYQKAVQFTGRIFLTGDFGAPFLTLQEAYERDFSCNISGLGTILVDLLPYLHLVSTLRGDASEDSPFQFNEYYIFFGNETSSPFYLRFGKQYLPFALFIPDQLFPSLSEQFSPGPNLSMEFGYTNSNGDQAAIYLYRPDEKILSDSFGISLSKAFQYDLTLFTVKLDYLNDLRTSITFEKEINSQLRDQEEIPAFSLGLKSDLGPFGYQFNLISALHAINIAGSSRFPLFLSLIASYKISDKKKPKMIKFFYQEAEFGHNDRKEHSDSIKDLAKRTLGMTYSIQLARDLIGVLGVRYESIFKLYQNKQSNLGLGLRLIIFY